MATINPSQDYDIIHTLTYASSGGTAPIRLYRGANSAITGTVYYRAGTSGAWTSLSVSGTSTTFPITSTTMQIAHNWNKSGNNYMTPNLMNGTMTGIAISQKAVLSGIMGNYFMFNYALGCSNLTTLDVPNTSGLTSAGSDFMAYYARNCSNLTTLAVPDTSGMTSVGYFFMYLYASYCSSLTTLAVPDTSGMTSVDSYFMSGYAIYCSSLTTLAVPDTSGMTSVDSNFMYLYASSCSSLTKLNLPKAGWFKTNNVSWSVPSGRLGLLRGKTSNPTDTTDWQALTVSGKTLHTNYIRDSSLVGENFSPTTTLNSPANNATLTTTTPTLAFTAADPEGDDVQYQIQVGNADFSTLHMDVTTATFPSGTQQTRVVSPALTQGAIDYYWRVRAKDPSGSDSYGAWSETRRMISSYLQPIASFTQLYTTGVVPHTVFFTDTTTGPATEWLWDFGDGNTSTERNPSHTYEEIGNYTVTLTATNPVGTDTVTKTNLITVTPIIVYGAIRADLKLSGSILTRWRRGIAITSALKLGGSIRAVVQKDVKGVEGKKYLYKVYDEDGTYIETWNDVKDEPQFTHEINSLGSSMTVELARTSDSTQQHVEPLETESDIALQTESGLTIDAALTARNNIGPGTSIHHNNRVDVWAFYGNDGSGDDVALLLEDNSPILLEDGDYIILDSVEPIERRIFSGFISDINSRYGSTESTVVALSSYGWDLDQYLLTSGTNTTVTYNSYDPSDIARDAIDKFVVTSADPDNLTYIHRTPTSIETTSTVVSYTFRNNTIAEVINKSLELMPSDWYYYVGLGDNVVYFSQRSDTPDHIFTLGKHIISLDLRSYTGNSVNDVVFTGGGDPALYKRYTAPRADRTRRTLSRLADSRVTVEQSAQILSEGTIERNNTMQYRTTLAVASKVYDIEKIRVGDMVGFRNFGNYVDDLEFQIVGISYSPDTAQLQLSTLLPDVNQRLEDIRRNMLVEENKNIPNSPS